jgi:hypothetical protein
LGILREPLCDLFSQKHLFTLLAEMRVYVFNVTNSDSWMNGSDAKIRVQQVPTAHFMNLRFRHKSFRTDIYIQVKDKVTSKNYGQNLIIR